MLLDLRMFWPGLAQVCDEGPFEFDVAQPTYAYSVAELEAAVDANTNWHGCNLDHACDPENFHKEPVVAALPGDAADFGGTRALLHQKGPDGVWRTTAVGTVP